MKKMKKTILIFGAIITLLFSCSSAIADGSVDDETNDIFHYSNVEGVVTVNPNDNKPNIDIDTISYAVNGDQLELTMTLVEGGTFQDTGDYYYWVSYNSTDTFYYIYYGQSIDPFGAAMRTDDTLMFDYDPEITVSGNTLTGTFNVLGDTTNQKLWGYAHEYTVYGDTTAEWWGDYAPGSYYPYLGLISDDTPDDDTPDGDPNNNDDTIGTDDTDTGGNGGDNKKDDSPGFELLALIAAIGIALIILRRKK